MRRILHLVSEISRVLINIKCSKCSKKSIRLTSQYLRKVAVTVLSDGTPDWDLANSAKRRQRWVSK